MGACAVVPVEIVVVPLRSPIENSSVVWAAGTEYLTAGAAWYAMMALNLTQSCT